MRFGVSPPEAARSVDVKNRILASRKGEGSI